MFEALADQKFFVPFAVGSIVVLRLWNLSASALIWPMRNQIADGVQKLDPRFKAAIG